MIDWVGAAIGGQLGGELDGNPNTKDSAIRVSPNIREKFGAGPLVLITVHDKLRCR